MKQDHLQPSFVEFIPETLQDGILYVAMEYQTVAHRCCCGCGSPVYLPLSPTQWRLTFNGESIWIEPSVGSWSLRCRSHYWIDGNRVVWAESWDRSKVELNRARDAAIRQQWHRPNEIRGVTAKGGANVRVKQASSVSVPARHGIWFRITKWLRRD